MVGLSRKIVRGTAIIVALRVALHVLKLDGLSNGDENNRARSTLPKLQFHTVPLSESMFFVETNEEAVEARGRTLCALESAAKMNPDKNVYFLVNERAPLSSIPRYMERYPNLLARSLNIDELAKGSALEELWFSGQVQASEHYLSHTSDILRFMLLSRFGGMYMDQDVLFLKPLPKDSSNFLISEGNNIFLTSAILKLEKGHPLLGVIVRRLAVSYDAYIWNMNGPAVLTYAVNTYCDNPPKVAPPGDYFAALNCSRLKIYEAEYGCPVKAGKFKTYYNESQWDEFRQKINKSIVMHYFNKMRVKELIKQEEQEELSPTDLDYRINVKHPLYRIMKQVCPETEANVLRFVVGGYY